MVINPTINERVMRATIHLMVKLTVLNLMRESNILNDIAKSQKMITIEPSPKVSLMRNCEMRAPPSPALLAIPAAVPISVFVIVD